jgi:hypothetical protein
MRLTESTRGTAGTKGAGTMELGVMAKAVVDKVLLENNDEIANQEDMRCIQNKELQSDRAKCEVIHSEFFNE